MAKPPLFTTYSLAKHLQVSPRTLQREVERGKLNYVIVGGRRCYRQADVDAYLNRRRQRARFRVTRGGLGVAAR